MNEKELRKWTFLLRVGRVKLENIPEPYRTELQ